MQCRAGTEEEGGHKLVGRTGAQQGDAGGGPRPGEDRTGIVAHDLRPRNVDQQRVPAPAQHSFHRCDGGKRVRGFNDAVWLPKQVNEAVTPEFHDLRVGLDFESIKGPRRNS
jgi:hypothetical protein